MEFLTNEERCQLKAQHKKERDKCICDRIKTPNLIPIERLWKWMKERIIYNTFYQYFEDFKAAIFGFFSMLSTLDPESILGKCFRSRARDTFSPIAVIIRIFEFFCV